MKKYILLFISLSGSALSAMSKGVESKCESLSSSSIIRDTILNSTLSNKKKAITIYNWIRFHPDDSSEKREAVGFMSTYISREHDKLISYLKAQDDELLKYKQLEIFLKHPYTHFLQAEHFEYMILYRDMLHSTLVQDKKIGLPNFARK